MRVPAEQHVAVMAAVPGTTFKRPTRTTCTAGQKGGDEFETKTPNVYEIFGEVKALQYL